MEDFVELVWDQPDPKPVIQEDQDQGEGTCPTEDYLINWSETQPILALIHGGVQKGKSTLFYTLANNVSLAKSNYTEEWDYTKYCARSLSELIDMVDKYDNKILGYEECERELDVSSWYSEFSKLFSLLIATQGYKKNTIILVMPCGLTVPNRHRRMINLGIEVIKKEEKLRKVWFKSTCYDHQFWKLDEDNIWYGHLGSTHMTYTEEQLAKAKIYTDWLIVAKQKIMDHIQDRSRLLEGIEFKAKDQEAMPVPVVRSEEKILPVTLS